MLQTLENVKDKIRSSRLKIIAFIKNTFEIQSLAQF